MNRRPPPTEGLAALSHEFRTPLNGVLGMARLLEGTRLTAEQRAYVSVLRESGEHLLSLVNDLLDHAKLGAGKLALDAALIDPAQLLQSTAELLSPRAHAKGLEIGWSVPAGTPLIVADEGRLRQVLLNLAGNAVKFTDAGGVHLGLTVQSEGPGRVRLRFLVSDTGPGVADVEKARIFDPFTQGAEAQGRAESTGLGLAIVKRLAEAHGGRVGVESRAGEGALFWFEAVFEAAPAEPLRGLPAGATIALVSRNASLIAAAREQVEALGGKALAFDTVEAAETSAPADAVILFDHVRGASRRRLRPSASHPTIVMVTPDERARIAAYREAGFVGYLIKPLRQISLADRVHAALGETAAATGRRKDERAAAETAPGARVLLVEDNPVNALLARKLLEREGCIVDAVTSGEAALSAVRPDHDLILMDRRLPGLDGLATTKRLRKAGCSAPIVALTADAFEEDRRLCLGAGMDAFLVKPLDPLALRGVLATALGGGWTRAATEAKLAS